MKKLLLVFFSSLLSATLMAQSSVQLVKDLTPGTASSFTEYYYDGIKSNLGDLVFISLINDNTQKRELFVSDGTDAGTVKIAESDNQYWWYEQFIQLDAIHMAFVLNSNMESVIYVTDGTVAGTQRLSYTDLGNTIDDLTYNNGKLYYHYYNDIREVNLIAGTDEIYLHSDGSILDYFWKDATTIYYAWSYNDWDDDANDKDILVSYNTTTGTGTDIYQFNPLYQTEMSFKNVNGKVIFYAEYADDKQLWSTDGTQAGTIQLTSFATSGAVTQYGLVHNNKIYIDAILSPNDPDIRGYEVFVSDGTVAGTYSLYSATTPFNYPRDLQVYNNEVYFSATDNYGTYQIYHTDGSINGTSKIPNTQFSGNYYLYLTQANNTLYFLSGAAYGAEDIGYELWSYDGSNFQYYETAPGSDDLDPEDLYGTPSKLFVSAIEDATGRELYLFNNSITTGVTSKNELTQQLVAYPNPASDVISAEHLSGAPVKIVSIMSPDGKVYAVNNNNGQVNLSQLSAGLYFLEVESNGSTGFVKFMKK